jgi:hypothetical protein
MAPSRGARTARKRQLISNLYPSMVTASKADDKGVEDPLWRRGAPVEAMRRCWPVTGGRSNRGGPRFGHHKLRRRRPKSASGPASAPLPPRRHASCSFRLLPWLHLRLARGPIFPRVRREFNPRSTKVYQIRRDPGMLHPSPIFSSVYPFHLLFSIMFLLGFEWQRISLQQLLGNRRNRAPRYFPIRNPGAAPPPPMGHHLLVACVV